MKKKTNRKWMMALALCLIVSLAGAPTALFAEEDESTPEESHQESTPEESQPVTPANYIVSFDANGGGGSIASQTFSAGSSFTLPSCNLTAPEGFRFKAWSIDGEEYAVGVEITIDHSITIVAVWTDVSYNIVFDRNGGTGYMSSVSVTAGEYVLPECKLTPPDGMEFKCWAIGEDEYEVEEMITITSNITLKAVWQNLTITIKFSANGGSGKMDPVEDIEANADYKLPKCTFTPPEGMRFKAWLYKEMNYKVGNIINPTEDTLLKAVWEVDPNAGKSSAPESEPESEQESDPFFPSESGEESDEEEEDGISLKKLVVLGGAGLLALGIAVLAGMIYFTKKEENYIEE